MRILCYDCFAGISGDMNLGALLDLGVPPEKLKQSLSFLGLDEAFELQIERGVKQGIAGTRAVVQLKGEVQPMRTLPEIKDLISKSALSEGVKDKSLLVFQALAEAEGKVHMVPPDQVHFHEVGAVDALVDIVGGVICLEELKADALWVSSLELGSGFAVCSHGKLPIPAPAVAELAKGFCVHQGGMPFEAATPTGVALLKGLQAQNHPGTTFVPEGVGYGLGTRNAEIPNVLRVWLGLAENAGDYQDRHGSLMAIEGKDPWQVGDAFVVETNIDDMNPEWYSFIEEKLFAAGAADVFRTPILMKKGRGAIQLSVLVPDTQTLRQVQDVLLTHTTTLGLRFYAVSKVAAFRQESVVGTPFGPVRVKWVKRGTKIVSKPEYDDCHRIAVDQGLTLHEVYEEIGHCFDKAFRK